LVFIQYLFVILTGFCSGPTETDPLVSRIQTAANPPSNVP
jgi:hypothetical protein